MFRLLKFVQDFITHRKVISTRKSERFYVIRFIGKIRTIILKIIFNITNEAILF